MLKADFCTCADTACPYHAINQNGECTACIAKNLKNYEIPACFWKKIGKDANYESDYNFHEFSKEVIKCKNE